MNSLSNVILLVGCLACCLCAGCGSGPPNVDHIKATDPIQLGTAEERIERINMNPSLSEAEKQSRIAQIKAHQGGGSK